MLNDISENDMAKLDAWLCENPEHRRQFEAFMARTDMLSVYAMTEGTNTDAPATDVTLNKKPRMRQYAWGGFIGAIAAGLVALMIFLWQGDSKVVKPELTPATIAAMKAAETSGHNNADLIIRNTVNESIEGSNASFGNDSLLNVFCQNFDSEEALSADIVTHHDKEFWLTLPDGTRVHLNYNTKLTYPLQFSGDTREVALDGEAYFFVAKDSKHPFIVHTQYGDVKQYGTEFNINTHYDSQSILGTYGVKGKGVAVVLVNGSISVITRNGERMIRPSEMALLSADATPSVKQVDTALFTSWNTGTFAFEGCPLEKLMDVIAKWYGVEIEFRTESYRQVHFTGELDKYDSIKHDLHAISLITGLDIRLERDKIVVE